MPPALLVGSTKNGGKNYKIIWLSCYNCAKKWVVIVKCLFNRHLSWLLLQYIHKYVHLYIVYRYIYIHICLYVLLSAIVIERVHVIVVDFFFLLGVIKCATTIVLAFFYCHVFMPSNYLLIFSYFWLYVICIIINTHIHT